MALFFVFLKSWALSFVKKNHGFLFFCLFVLELVREGVIFLDFLESGCFWLMIFFLALSCRKKKAVHKSSTTDDKKLQSTLKRIGVNTIPAIEEVNIFKDDLVIQFVNPKVQASVVANTWVITGTPQTRSKFLTWRCLFVDYFNLVGSFFSNNSSTALVQ